MIKINNLTKYFIISAVFSILILSCSSTKNHLDQSRLTYKFVPVTIFMDNDSTIVNELQIYNIEKWKINRMLYENFGRSAGKLQSRYEDSISATFYANMDLLQDGRAFSVITDDSNDLDNIFTTILVFDEDRKDCFDDHYKDRSKLVDSINSKTHIVINKYEKLRRYNLMRANRGNSKHKSKYIP